ncbi:MAG: hypothetical protein FJZ47_10420 [Candidatus Tectomicrobia bacterium]|uniref:Carbohydrate-binding domain-containing protein n=1 Tax=Tectimicrobiota bacterium TaxID=2528274 RepID=A0A938B2N5_UNCTE|nr:hypothetical protein [Candidatus Tectomicrobia bacterium]
MIIPYMPGVLTLPIETYWDGTPCHETPLHATVALGLDTQGLCLTATMPLQAAPRIPSEMPLTRVANLWEYDVVECFLAGPGRYLEVELGAGGHFLVLDFSAPRVRQNDYATFTPAMTFEPALAGHTVWRASIHLPWSMLPEPIQGVNAYVISGGKHLCYQPLPGPAPDFHQPARFPAVRLAERP